jgi:hypothetical protein
MPGKLKPQWLIDAIDKKCKTWKEYQSLQNIILDGCVSMRLQTMGEHPAYEEYRKLGESWGRAANDCIALERTWNAMTPEEQLKEVQG